MKSIKIFVFGSSAVGTSCIIDKFVYDEFEKKTLPTIGIDYRCKRKDDSTYEIYVASGMFCSVAKYYVNRCDYFIFVYDITNRKSFIDIEKYYDYLIGDLKLKIKKVKLFLVGNKLDLEDEERKVTRDEGIDLAIRYGMTFYETSAKTGSGIPQLFEEIRGPQEEKKDDGKRTSSNWFLNLFSCCNP